MIMVTVGTVTVMVSAGYCDCDGNCRILYNCDGYCRVLYVFGFCRIL